MKRFLFLTLCVAAIAVSCKKSDPQVMVQAVVTVKNGITDSQCFFQVDDETAMIPTNYQANPFKKQTRAITYYYDKGEATAPQGSTTKYWRSGEVLSLSEILTKEPVPSAEGTAPIEIYRSWVNTIEDGYITLFFEGLWGPSRISHTINLVRDQSKDSVSFTIKHNANGDTVTPPYRAQGLIAFHIGEIAKPQGKDEFNVFINYKGYTTDKRIYFHYKGGKYYGPYRDNSSEAIDEAESEAEQESNFE